MNNMFDMMLKIDSDRACAEERLLKLCQESKKLKYENLISKLQEITENKLGLNSYKFGSFIEWLADDLEHFRVVNSDSWDMTHDEIDKKFDNDYWKNEFEKNKHEDWNECKTWEDFRKEYEWWSYGHCLSSSLNSLKKEYEYRKNKGMID